MNTVSIPVSRNAHQTQFPETPFCRTISVTRLGVSAENVVATIEIPNSHQGMLRPDKKYWPESFPDLKVNDAPIASESAKKPIRMVQSMVVSSIVANMSWMMWQDYCWFHY